MSDTKTIGKEIKQTVKKHFPKVKLSVTTDYNHIDVAVTQADFNPMTDEKIINDRRGELNVNHYYFKEDKQLSPKMIKLFETVDKVIKKYHWDNSDPMTDYFNCAFYYTYRIGKYDKPFKRIL